MMVQKKTQWRMREISNDGTKTTQWRMTEMVGDGTETTVEGKGTGE